MWTSKAYAHSTAESAGVEWEGGERRSRFEVNLETDKPEIEQPERCLPENRGNYNPR